VFESVPDCVSRIVAPHFERNGELDAVYDAVVISASLARNSFASVLYTRTIGPRVMWCLRRRERGGEQVKVESDEADLKEKCRMHYLRQEWVTDSAA
jgi:hypothetical protein